MPRLPRPAVIVVLSLVTLAACKDKPEVVPVQQGESAANPSLSKAAAPATKAPPAPRPAPPSPAALASAELTKATQVRTVQVGSFPNANAARWWASELQRTGIPASTVTATVDGKETTRLRVGAALTGAEARAIADRIHARYKWPVWIVMVEDRSPLSGEMLVASRAYIGR